MKSWAVRLWLIVLFIAAGLYGWRVVGQTRRDREPPPNQTPIVLETGIAVAPFTLVERNGATFDSASLEGKTWIASFFFTQCQGPCLNMNARLAKLQQELADADVRFVSITVDPESDTPQALSKYADHFQADAERWLFLTGELDAIKAIANEGFKVGFGRATHSTRLILVDPQGKIAGYYDAASEPDLRVLEGKARELAGGVGI